MDKPLREGAKERWAPAPSLCLTALPEDILRDVLRRLEPQGIGAGKAVSLAGLSVRRLLLFALHSLSGA